MENEFPVIKALIAYITERAMEESLVYANGLKQCLKQMMADGVEKHKQREIFKDVFLCRLVNSVVNETATSTDKLIREGVFLKTILPLFKEELAEESERGVVEDLLRKKVSIGSSNVSSLVEVKDESRSIGGLVALDVLMAAFPENFFETEGQ